MSNSSGSQRAVNYLERRADFSALDAMVSKRRGIDALRMNAETGWPALAPIKVRDSKYSTSYFVGTCSSALASASTMSYSSGSRQASKFDPDWFRIGSPRRHSRSASSKSKKKSHSRNKDSTISRDKKKSHPKDKEASAIGEKQKTLAKASSTKDEKIHMHADKELATIQLDSISAGTNEIILNHGEAALRRRLERKVSRDRETRSVRKARLRSMVRSMQFSSREDLDPALLEHTDDEEHIYHYPYCTNAESHFVIPAPPTSRSRHCHTTAPHPTQSVYRRPANAPSGARSVARINSGRTNYRACKRSLLRWMAQAMCKQPLAKHY